MTKQSKISPNNGNINSKVDQNNCLNDMVIPSPEKKFQKIDLFNEDFWFDYRIWCILFKVNLEQIQLINQFISNKVLNTEEDYLQIESIIYQLEKKKTNNLIRCDFERFRTNIDEKGISFPKLPKNFYDINGFLEFIEKDFYFNTPEKELHELLEVLSFDFFPSISNLKLVDRLVFVTIVVCEYLNFNYLQGMHEIIGCLAFLKENPIPINYHIILSIEIIKRWAKFLILPNLFNNCNSILNEKNANKSEKNTKNQEIIKANNENIVGFLHSYFTYEQSNEFELIYQDTANNLQFEFCTESNKLGVKFGQYFEKKTYKPIYQSPDVKISAVEQILNICNEFHSFGCFHIPTIFNEIEKSIESNIWCCNVFITCGSILFTEIENVLLFWLNLIFSSSDIDYKPPYFPKIPSSLQLATFIIVLLKSLEHKLKDDIYLICTDKFKLDMDLNVRIGIVSILHPFLISNNNIEGADLFATAQHCSLNEFIEKKSLFLDLFQVILAMESLLMSTPMSLQNRIINSLDDFGSTSSFESICSKNFINIIEPKELMFYDKDFSIKNKKCLNGVANVISGKDVVLVDILSRYYFDNTVTSELDRLIKKLENTEEFVKHKELGNKNIDNEFMKLFDEEVSSILLLPLLRLSLKTTRIVKIPVQNDKEFINSQVISQFLEFASRRQQALLIQQRPCIWVICGPNNKTRDEFASKLIENGIIGVQLIDAIKVFFELLEKYYSTNNFDLIISIIKDVKSNLCFPNNRPSYKSRALLKISTLKKKNCTDESLITMNTIDYNQNKESSSNTEIKSSNEKQEYLNMYNKIIKFKPNRRKMYYK